MVQGKVEICGVNTAKLPLLKQQEKEALFVRIKEGDNEAREEFIKGNLRLVLRVIKRFSSSNEEPYDAVVKQAPDGKYHMIFDILCGKNILERLIYPKRFRIS